MDKQSLRERVWDRLEDDGVARFPFPPHGRIPNFAGADDAADRLTATDAWTDAGVLKANPDAPQLPVRRRALHENKVVYMAQPRLRSAEPFMKLDPAEIPPEDLDAAATVSSMDDYAEPVGPDAVPGVDLVVSGSVAVDEAGKRVGKGEGYSDLEFAVLAELGAVDAETTVATTVHEYQVVGAGEIETDAHDVPMDLVVTPERTVETGAAGARPTGVDWDLLGEERVAEIPVLERLRER
ncbi:5-formyltetrahydrofolate cyclo-ligase [Halobium salinum]|uniref:5-formyltetrahydrofolate cyclo-ligase n=1 Tax=Halobium salinum TaxID=1364940 RepID=A0ABD5PAZ8_9EURY|nr:5-formyltetrahydrofolate cyclo-ligase [Halobium salinum]